MSEFLAIFRPHMWGLLLVTYSQQIAKTNKEGGRFYDPVFQQYYCTQCFSFSSPSKLILGLPTVLSPLDPYLHSLSVSKNFRWKSANNRLKNELGYWSYRKLDQ